MVYDIFNNAFYAILSNLFCSCFFPYSNDRTSRQRVILVSLWIIIQNIWALPLSQVSFVQIIGDVIISIVFVILIYRTSAIKTTIIQLLYLGLYISGELAIFLLDMAILGVDALENIENTPYYVYSGFLSQLFVFFAIVVIRYFIRKKDYSLLKIRDWLPFLIFPALTTVLAVLIVLGFGLELTRTQEILLNSIAISIIVINLAQFYTLTSITNKEMRLRENEVLITKAAALEEMYSQISEVRERQKSINHDTIKCLSVSLALARKANNEELVNLLSEQLNITEQYGDVYDCGNSIINAIINTKYIEAKDKSIRVNYILSDLSKLKISNIDLIVIVANILDNAIEATELLEEEYRWIAFRAEVKGNELIICAENSCAGDIKANGEIISTSKRNDNDNHGYGISNIKSTVQKYSGDCFINTDDGVFKIVAILPI